MSVKLATATETISASTSDFYESTLYGVAQAPDSKNKHRFDLVLSLQGQIPGQTKGNALEPKVTVRMQRKWSQSIPRHKI